MTQRTSEENKIPMGPPAGAGGPPAGAPVGAGGPPPWVTQGEAGGPQPGVPLGAGGPPPWAQKGGRRLPPWMPAGENGLVKGSPAVMIAAMIISGLLVGSYLSFFVIDLPYSVNMVVMPFLYVLPLMLVSSIYGFPFGIFSYLIVCIMTMIWHMDRVYTLSYQLIALFLTNMYMARQVYRSIRKILLMTIATAPLFGLLNFLNMWLVYDGDQTQVPPLYACMILALCERLVAWGGLALFYRFQPKKAVSLFPVSGFYHEYRTGERGKSEFYSRGQSKLGRKLGKYMALEAAIMALVTGPFVRAVYAEQLMIAGAGGSLGSLASITFMVKVILFNFAMTVPMVVAFNFSMYGKIINPLMMMTRGLEEFAGRTGEDRKRAEGFIRSVNVKTDDELETLYKAMTDMVGEINGYIDRMQKEKELEENLRVAQAANEAKTHFISHMSHEIRTPINAVIGMDEMIMRETQEKNILHYARDIRNAGRSLLSIVNDILDFSRIESGKLEIIEGEYEVSSVLNDLVSMITSRVREKGLDFKVRVDETLPHVLIGDEVRLRQCILNILTNAVKYTQQGKIRLKVNYEEAGDDKIALTVSVEDSGVGIRKDELEKLLMPFERIDEVNNRTIEGTGLGLAITANLLGLMGSKIEVESEYGRGSNFHFTVIQGVANREPIGDFNEMHDRLAMQQTHRHVLQAPGIRILAVDDTHTNLTVIKGLLKETGIIVDTVASGKEMLDKVTEVYYDLIFLDQRMPVMDGIEALHLMQVMADVRNPEAPVIALTANVISGAREMFLKEGFDDYLPKPIDPKELENALLKHLPEGRVTIIEREVNEPQDEQTGELGEMRELLKNLAQTDELDIDAGLKNCGDADTFIETVRDFHHLVHASADALEEALKKEDYVDYGIRIHSLKSTARVVGAMELSKQAMQEEAWCDAGEYEKLQKDAPSLLAKYRSYYDILSFMKEPDEEEGAEEEKEEITLEKLHEAYGVIRELTDAFDYDTATDVYKMLKDFRIPKEEQMLYNEIGEYLRRLDRDRILELLSEIG